MESPFFEYRIISQLLSIMQKNIYGISHPIGNTILFVVWYGLKFVTLGYKLE